MVVEPKSLSLVGAKERIYVRNLTLKDLDACVSLENQTFVPEERCSRKQVCPTDIKVHIYPPLLTHQRISSNIAFPPAPSSPSAYLRPLPSPTPIPASPPKSFLDMLSLLKLPQSSSQTPAWPQLLIHIQNLAQLSRYIPWPSSQHTKDEP